MNSTTLVAALGFETINLGANDAPFDHHEVTLIKDGVAGQPELITDPTTTSVEFDSLVPGSYTCTAVSIDKNGNAMAPLQTSDAVVISVASPGTASVINSITLSLGTPPATGTALAPA